VRQSEPRLARSVDAARPRRADPARSSESDTTSVQGFLKLRTFRSIRGGEGGLGHTTFGSIGAGGAMSQGPRAPARARRACTLPPAVPRRPAAGGTFVSQAFGRSKTLKSSLAKRKEYCSPARLRSYLRQSSKPASDVTGLSDEDRIRVVRLPISINYSFAVYASGTCERKYPCSAIITCRVRGLQTHGYCPE
jgi:hypothetical protein